MMNYSKLSKDQIRAIISGTTLTSEEEIKANVQGTKTTDKAGKEGTKKAERPITQEYLREAFERATGRQIRFEPNKGKQK